MKRRGKEYIGKIRKYFSKGYKYRDICKLINKKYDADLSFGTLGRILRDHGLSRRNFEENSVMKLFLLSIVNWMALDAIWGTEQ